MDPGVAVDRLKQELSRRSHKYNASSVPPGQWYHMVAGSQK